MNDLRTDVKRVLKQSVFNFLVYLRASPITNLDSLEVSQAVTSNTCQYIYMHVYSDINFIEFNLFYS